MPNPKHEGGWAVASEILLTWLADEIVKASRHEKPFEQWLREEQIDGAFTHREKQDFEIAIKSQANVLISGASTIIESLYYSCFISYSHEDEEFAKKLHSRMQEEGLRVWFAPEDVKGGKKIHEQICDAIKHYDKLLLVLSDKSMASEWVATEIYQARQKEINEDRRILFPVRVVEIDKIKNWEYFDHDTGKDIAREIREYFIPDFTDWKNSEAFEKSFQRLLKNLRTENK